MNKGFTLIEVLGVIVVLAAIVLITSPIALHIINSSKENINARSAKQYLDAVEFAIKTKNMDTYGNFSVSNCKVHEHGNLLCENNEKVEVDASGVVPSKGTITFENGEIKYASLLINNRTVTQNKSGKLEIMPISESFAKDSWEEIVANVKSGNVDSYKVGEEKEITLQGEIEGTYKVRVANTSTATACSNLEFSQSACGFVIEFIDIIDVYPSNLITTNKGGWKDSEMRMYANDAIYNSLPDNIKENILDTYVVSGYGSDDTSNFITIDKIYLLSLKEVLGSEIDSSYDTAVETRQLDYYENILEHYKNNETLTEPYFVPEMIKKYNGEVYSWWLRTPSIDDSKFFWFLSSEEVSDFGISVAFRL